MTAYLSTPTRSPMSHRTAVALLMFTAFLWSSSGLFIKLLDLPPLAIWGARSWVVFVVFLLYLRPKTWRFTFLELMAALGFMGAQFFFVAGNKHAPAANVIFLQYTSPIYVILLAYWLLREKPTRSDWIAMAIIFVGMLLFLGDGFQLDATYGNVLAIISGVAMAVMMVAMRMQQAGNPARSILLGGFLGGLISIPTIAQTDYSLTDGVIIFYLGAVQIGLAMIIFSHVIKHLEALEATLITTLEPILNPVWVFLILGELPSVLALIGAALVLLAVLIRAFAGTQSPT